MISYSTCFLAISGFALFACSEDERIRPAGPTVTDVIDDGRAGAANAGAGSGPAAGAPNQVDDGVAVLGTACAVDADCAEGLECLESSGDGFLGGGPANGYCTATCQVDAECQAFDSSGLCVEVDSVSLCIQGCDVGSSLLTKCHNRADVACQDGSRGGFCRPVCAGDEDCAGRKCHLGTGVCVDSVPPGGAIGAECDPDGVDQCATGLCLSFSDDFAACSGLCNLSLPMNSCGRSVDPTSAGAASCSLGGADLSLGDLGRCNQGCSCDDDCLHPDAVCWVGPFGTEPDATALYGTRGLCVGPDQVLPDGAQFGGTCSNRSDGGLPDGGLTDAAVPDSGSVQTPDAAVHSPIDASEEADAQPPARGDASLNDAG